MKAVLLASALALVSSQARAEGEVTYRARVTFEAAAIAANRASPLVPRDADRWSSAGRFLAAGDSVLETAGRLRLAGGATLVWNDGGVTLTAREAYARLSATSWMDIEAGKRLVRWGVGYGFSPTGVLDPPRIATDPNDRLGLNEGLMLARADLYRGGTSLTLAATAPRVWRESPADAPQHLLAARLRTVVGNGVEVALVASATSGGRRDGERRDPHPGPSWGGNLTHVIGRQLEWHAELLLHDRRDARASVAPRVVSAVAGLQYTFAAGVNVVLEYHRHGHGLDDDAWDAVRGGERDPGPAPGRQQFVFLRAARAGADHALSPELIVVAGLDDGAWTVVPAVTWTPQKRLQVSFRLTHLAGGRRSIAAVAPWSTAATLGLAARF